MHRRLRVRACSFHALSSRKKGRAIYTTLPQSPLQEYCKAMVDHDLVSRTGCYRMLMRVSATDVLGPDEESICPIQMEDFDKARLEFMDPSGDHSCFVQGRPELCVGTLPCGHRFCPSAVVYHMCISGMQCPVCRAGTKEPLRISCVPAHLRGIFQVGPSKVLPEEPRVRL